MGKSKKSLWLKVPGDITLDDNQEQLIELIDFFNGNNDSNDIRDKINDEYDRVTQDYITAIERITAADVTRVTDNSEDSYLNDIQRESEHNVSHIMEIREVANKVAMERVSGEREETLSPWELELKNLCIEDQFYTGVEVDEGERGDAIQDQLLELSDNATQEYLNKIAQIEALSENPFIDFNDLRKIEAVEDVYIQTAVKDKAVECLDNPDEVYG